MTVALEEVRDRKSLEAYLDSLPEDERRAVALRVASNAALRVLPIAARDFLTENWARERDLTPVSVFGACSISRVASVLPTREIAATASRATAAAFAASRVAARAAATAAARTAARAAATAAAASRVAATADAATAAAFAATALDLWPLIRRDLVEESAQVWPEGTPRAMADIWVEAVAAMRADNADWSFWIAWYDRALAGREWHPEAMTPILNEITEKDWNKGPGHINPMFDEVLALYRADDELSKATAPEIETTSCPDAVARTKGAMIRHRATLPPTFDDILAYAAQEVANLQSRNYRNDEDHAFAKRQVEVIKTIHVAVAGLRDLVPTGDTMADADATRAHGLLQQIVGRLKAWPSLQGEDGRTNLERTVDQSVEGTIGAAGKATKAALFAGVGYVLLLLWGPQFAAGALGLAFGEDAMGGFKEMIGAKDEKS